MQILAVQLVGWEAFGYLLAELVLDKVLLYGLGTEIILSQHYCDKEGESENREEKKKRHKEDSRKDGIDRGHGVDIVVPKNSTQQKGRRCC